MGYYSDVALCLTRTGVAKLATAIEAHVNNTPEDFASSAIEEVAFVESFMADLEYAEYYFIRVGEDYDDIETHGCFRGNPFNIPKERKIIVG